MLFIAIILFRLNRGGNILKKLISTLAFLFVLGILTACGSEDDAKPKEKEIDEGSEMTAERVVAEEDNTEITTTFENGILETEIFSLEISKAEIIQSPMEDKPGLFVTFSLDNKSADQDVIPNETLSYLNLQQESETSRIDLMEGYHFLDAFGDEDDVETYNKMVDLANSSSNALLPGKSIEFVEAYELDNETHDVTFIGLDENTFEEVGKHTVKLKN